MTDSVTELAACTHELWDRETACADGMCPLCMKAKLLELMTAGQVALSRICELIEERDDLRLRLRNRRVKCNKAYAECDKLQASWNVRHEQ